MISYATAEDVTAFDADVELPARIDRWLMVANGLVEDTIRVAVYESDPDTGVPTDSVLADAARTAVAVQIAAWVDSGADPLGGVGTSEQSVTSKTLQGIGSVTYGTTSTGGATIDVPADQLCDEAWRVLRRAGLIGQVVFG